MIIIVAFNIDRARRSRNRMAFVTFIELIVQCYIVFVSTSVRNAWTQNKAMDISAYIPIIFFMAACITCMFLKIYATLEMISLGVSGKNRHMKNVFRDADDYKECLNNNDVRFSEAFKVTEYFCIKDLCMIANALCDFGEWILSAFCFFLMWQTKNGLLIFPFTIIILIFTYQRRKILEEIFSSRVKTPALEGK